MNKAVSPIVCIARAVLPTALLITVVILWGQAFWILAKAQLAQYLIAASWQASLQQQQPQKPWPWADTWPVAKLQFPEQGSNLYVLAGTDGSALAFGPGLDLQTTAKSTIVHGHRDTHFKILEYLHAGETIQLQTSAGVTRDYTVKAFQVIDSSQTSLVVDKDAQTLYLITCYPFNAISPGGPLRYVVQAEPQTNTVEFSM